MEMRPVKKEIKEPELIKGFFESVDFYGGAGDTTPKTKITTYECSSSFEFIVKVEEEIEPGKNSKGQPKPRSDKRRIHVEVGFPFDFRGMKGRIKLPVYATTVEEVPNRILEEIGGALAELAIRPSLKD